jgi:hypothetical protein
METKFFICEHVVIKAEYFETINWSSDRLVSVCSVVQNTVVNEIIHSILKPLCVCELISYLFFGMFISHCLEEGGNGGRGVPILRNNIQ